MEQLAARWAHNPKVGGSSPPPATNFRGFSLFFFILKYFILIYEMLIYQAFYLKIILLNLFYFLLFFMIFYQSCYQKIFFIANGSTYMLPLVFSTITAIISIKKLSFIRISIFFVHIFNKM